MDLGEVPDNTIGVDPVSGNEIPLGSTAENVRDDIPANLSEGEIVVAADVVNFHGVKLFEDLRKQAKMGYAEMAQDGRIGGEPIMDNEIDIEFTIEDLEVMDSPDAAEPEDAFLGKFFAGIREANRKQQEANTQKRDRSYKAIKARAQANKGKPKNRAEAIIQALQNAFRDDSDKKRPQLKSKPATSDDAKGPSIAEQINFGGDYRDKKEKTATKKPAQTKGAGQVTKAYTGDKDKESVRYYDKGFLERLSENLGFDEGGLVEEEPFYSQKGGFDMAEAASGSSGVQVIEYMNDEGHRIFITFIDGVPQTDIPEGYYPVGDPIDINTVVNAGDPETIVGISTGSTGVSDMGDSGSGSGANMPTPEAINYKELTFDELKGMVDDMSSFGTKLSGLSIVTKALMKLSHKSTIEEIKRRRDDPYTSEIDKRRYDELLELASKEQPGLVETIFNKITGKEPEGPPVRTQEQTDALYAQLDKMTKAYTPDPQTANDRTTPGVTEQGVDTADFGVMQNKYDEIARIEQELKSQPRPKDYDTSSTTDTQPPPPPPTPTQQRDRTRDAGRSARKTFEAFKNDPSKSKSIARNAPAVQRTESVIRDMERGVQRGFEKGGLAKKKSKKKK